MTFDSKEERTATDDGDNIAEVQGRLPRHTDGRVPQLVLCDAKLEEIFNKARKMEIRRQGAPSNELRSGQWLRWNRASVGGDVAARRRLPRPHGGCAVEGKEDLATAAVAGRRLRRKLEVETGKWELRARGESGGLEGRLCESVGVWVKD
ncbi:uncharacterized protein DS421_9g264220 [Arachis hypogaea]|nr:uncharacterized protein DS421_9g264220 [Arachis hypogaea]